MPFSVSNVALQEAGIFKETYNSDLVDVTADFVKEKSYSAAKVSYVAIDCLKEVGVVTDANTNVMAYHSYAKIFKLSRSPWEFIDNTTKCRRSFTKWWSQDTSKLMNEEEKKKWWGGLAQFIRDANGCVNPVWEMCDLMTKVILHLPKGMFETLKGINGGALILSMGWNVYDNLAKFAENSKLSAKEFNAKIPEMVRGMMKLAQQVAYLALGVLTVLSVFFGVSVASPYMTTLSAISVIFTILPYYHEHLGEQKTVTREL